MICGTNHLSGRSGNNMNILKGKSVLVTGGTGFIGSHLVEELIKIGAKVVTTYEDIDPRSYFMVKKFDQKVIMANVDVRNFDQLMGLITKFEIEYVFHLAAQAMVETAYYNPRRTLESNINGTINALECARLLPKIKAVMVASSDKAYGKMDTGKYVESDSLKGDHPYDVSKSAADLIANSYYKTYGVPVTITRFGNVYGQGDTNYSRIVPGIMKSIVEKKALEIRSNGKFMRDYLYVKDVVRGYLLLAENIENTKGQAYNFGSKENLSVLEVVKKIGKELKIKIAYKILDQVKNEIPNQSLDYEKIKKLGWKTKYTISSTSKKIYSWYKKILK